MTALVCFLAGLVLSPLLWLALRSMFASPALTRTNYRGHELPVASGLVIVVAVLVVSAGTVLADRLDLVDRPGLESSVIGAAALTLGTALLGFVDDVTGTAASRGFRGHLAALARGEVTSGLLKLVGTPLVAMLALSWTAPGFADLVRVGLVVALAANLGNLFDRAPGRTIKVGLLATLPLALWAGSAVAIAGPLAVVGAGAGLLAVDLGERAMLGDTGANALGAGVGALLVAGYGVGAQWCAVGVLVVLNATSEFVSFSRVIERVGPLRALDQAGRSFRPPRPPA